MESIDSLVETLCRLIQVDIESQLVMYLFTYDHLCFVSQRHKKSKPKQKEMESRSVNVFHFGNICGLSERIQSVVRGRSLSDQNYEQVLRAIQRKICGANDARYKIFDEIQEIQVPIREHSFMRPRN